MEITKQMRDALLEKRQLLVMGQFNSDTQEMITASILYLNALSSINPITLFIDSGGGNLAAELYAMDAIENSEAPIYGIATGFVGSAAFGVFQACHVRKAYPHASFKFHSPVFNGICIANRKAFARDLKRLRKTHQEQVEAFSKRSGQPKEKWFEWGESERQFNAREALELRIIDEIIFPPARDV